MKNPSSFIYNGKPEGIHEGTPKIYHLTQPSNITHNYYTKTSLCGTRLYCTQNITIFYSMMKGGIEKSINIEYSGQNQLHRGVLSTP